MNEGNFEEELFAFLRENQPVTREALLNFLRKWRAKYGGNIAVLIRMIRLEGRFQIINDKGLSVMAAIRQLFKLIIVGVSAGLAPGVILTLCGFASSGVVAGSLAAFIHSCIGNVAAGSLFAFLQSLGATGLLFSMPLMLTTGLITAVAYAAFRRWETEPVAPTTPDDEDPGPPVIPSNDELIIIELGAFTLLLQLQVPGVNQDVVLEISNPSDDEGVPS